MRKILGILAIGLMGLSVVSCEDFLDVTSENQMLLDDFYKSAEESSLLVHCTTAPWYPFNSRFYFIVMRCRANNNSGSDY